MLTSSQKKQLANDLIEVIERFQNYAETYEGSYEAAIMQPSVNHIVIKIQPSTEQNSGTADIPMRS